MRVFLSAVLFITALAPFASSQSELNLDSLRRIPILDGGRTKPLETFAGESMEVITGRWHFEKTDPLYLMLSFMTYNWMDKDIVRIEYYDLKTELGLNPREDLFSIDELSANGRLRELADQVFAKSQAEQDLSGLETEVGKLMHQINTFQDIVSGEGITIVPDVPGKDYEDELTLIQWSSIMNPQGYSEEETQQLTDTFRSMLIAFKEKDASTFAAMSSSLKDQLSVLNPNPIIYPTETQIEREIFYNNFKPYQKAMIVYLIAFTLFLIGLQVKSPLIYWSAIGSAGIGFLIHTYGMLVRSLIAGRPPVSNMYETVIYVGWAIVMIALIFELIQRKRWLGLTGSLVSVGMLIMANMMPFDPNIEPLVPVLRSNYWLIVHVMTIVYSYGAFALAMGLAHVVLILYLYFSHKQNLIRELNLFLYRSIQVGVVLLAAGTILGGVWAAESWGRFWGWDPKETWSLISLMGYMAILHARFAGWLRDFGIAFFSILAFQLIIFTWYGVNFILATGLHSYGFGAGGGTYVAGYLGLEVLFLSFIGWKYYTMQAMNSVSSAGTGEIASGS